MGLCLAQRMIEIGIYPMLTWRTETGFQRIQNRLEVCFKERFDTLLIDFSIPETLKTLSEKTANTLDYTVDFVQDNYESLIAGACDETVHDYFLHHVAFRAALLKKISRSMLARKKGRMIYVSSTAAIRQNPGQGFYAAAKQASETLYRNIGLELGDRGVTTVSLRPGYVDAGRGKAYFHLNKNEILKNKLLDVKHITDTILFLLSDSAEGFNASELVMDRGMTAGK